MQKNIIWEGLKYQSRENCIVAEISDRVEADAIITGIVNNQVFNVAYSIRANKMWEIYFAEIKVEINGKKNTLRLEKKAGEWFINNVPADEMKDCVDIDISLTPFTNTLPIRRLNFDIHPRYSIDVVYIDILGEQIKPVAQYYSKISGSVYLYEDATTNFKAELTTDESGLVIEYPNLFIKNGVDRLK